MKKRIVACLLVVLMMAYTAVPAFARASDYLDDYYDTLDAVEHPEFYVYDARTYLNEIPFDGTPGISYRVTVMVYAQRGSGSDTGYISSLSEVCK